MPVIALILGAPIAVVGQRDAWRAGVLLIATAAIPFVLLVIRYATGAGVQGPGFRSLFGTSIGAVVIPLAFRAALFLIAGSSSRHGSALTSRRHNRRLRR